MLPNLQNYGIYEELVKTKYQTIYTKDINKSNLDDHIKWITSILDDGIETEDEVHEFFVHVIYTDNEDIDLHIFDYWFNLMMWRLWTEVNRPIDSEALFFFDNITRKNIKYFEDHAFVRKYRDKISFRRLNNIPELSLRPYSLLNNYSYYLADTVDMESTVELMNTVPGFKELLKPDFSNVKFEDLKNEGLKVAKEQIRLIKKHKHCLAESFNSNEAINPKQFKEVNVEISTKPNGEDGVFPISIESSFINGGLYKPEYLYIESSIGRQAQILSKTNVSISGDFARLLGTNNIDTWLHKDPNYFCDTKHLVHIKINDKQMLNEYNLRFYKESLMDEEDKVIDSEVDTHLIGKYIYVYSPTKCASVSRGEGICRRCYGNLYFVNRDINPGKIASDLLSSRYTQTLLSAKHLLESAVVKMIWTDKFDDYFKLLFNTITLREGVDYHGYRIKIDREDITLEDDDADIDSGLYNEFISSFILICPDGTELPMNTREMDDIYISKDLNKFIRMETSAEDDDFIYIDLNRFNEIHQFDDGVLFLMKIRNDELSKTLNRAKKIIDKSAITSSFDIDGIIAEFIKVNNEGNICLNAVHYETIIMNQIRCGEDLINKPDWSLEDPGDYSILTLKQSLANNPSIVVQLEYKKVSDTLCKPLSFKKTKASFLDLYFMKQPQKYIKNPNIPFSEKNYVEDDHKESNKIPIVTFVDKDELNKPKNIEDVAEEFEDM